MPFFSAAEEVRLGHRPHRLGGRGICSRRSTIASSASCPAISRRIRKANTSSTAAGRMPMSAPAGAIIRSCNARFPLHARDRPLACLIRNDVDPRADPRGAGERAHRAEPMSARRHPLHVTFCARRPKRNSWPSTASCSGTDQQFHWHNQDFCELRRFPRLPQLTPPQGDQARAPRGRGRRRHDPPAHRQRHHRRRLGTRFFEFYMGDRLAQMGPARIWTRKFFSLIGEGEHEGGTCCW